MFGKYFYGNEISEYGQQHGRVDYRTFAKSFDAVLNNDIMQQTEAVGLGYWEPTGGSMEYYEDSNGNRYTYDEAQERIEELRQEIDDLSEDITEDSSEEEDAKIYATIHEIESDIEALEEPYYDDVYQWYIISDNGARICEEFGEIVYYNETLDMYLWGVTHYGTSWDYVLTDIPCSGKED